MLMCGGVQIVPIAASGLARPRYQATPGSTALPPAAAVTPTAAPASAYVIHGAIASARARRRLAAAARVTAVIMLWPGRQPERRRRPRARSRRHHPQGRHRTGRRKDAGGDPATAAPSIG